MSDRTTGAGSGGDKHRSAPTDSAAGQAAPEYSSPPSPPVLTKRAIVELLAPHPPRTNLNIFRVDDKYAVRVARIAGEYPWHRHEQFDEAWVILSGRANIRTVEGELELGPLEAVLIPAGTRHSPAAIEEGTTVMIINAKEFTTTYLGGDTDESAGYREFDVGQR
jgi:mannose-6-phosphate isomerase-like protein (cupin superfamily)